MVISPLLIIYFASIFSLLLICACGAMEFLNVYVVTSVNQRLVF